MPSNPSLNREAPYEVVFMRFCVGLILLTLTVSASGQDPDGPPGYIEVTLQSQLGEVPRMAWLVPPNLVLVEEKHSAIHVVFSGVWEARHAKEVEGNALEELRSEHSIFCQTAAEGTPQRAHLYRLEGASVKEVARAFYFAKRPAGIHEMGLRRALLPASLQASVVDPVRKERPNSLYRNVVYTAPDGKLYSFHAFYDLTSKEAFKEGFMLSRRDGSILAQEFRDLTEDNTCVDCGLPLYDSKSVAFFFPINVLQLPGFAHPVLVMDTSTVEGRAVSLVTFDEKGKRAEFRLYEYVLSCPGT